MSNADKFDKASAFTTRDRVYIPLGRTVLEVRDLKEDTPFNGGADYFLAGLKILAPVDGEEAFARPPGQLVSYYQDLKYPDNMGKFKKFLEVAYAAIGVDKVTKKEFAEAVGEKQRLTGAVIVCDCFPMHKKDGSRSKVNGLAWSLPTEEDLEMVEIVKQKMAERKQALIASLGQVSAPTVASADDDNEDDLDEVFGAA